MKLVQNYRCTSIPWECWSRLGTLGWHSDSLQGKTPSASWFHERFQGKFCWWQVVFLPSFFLQISINRCKDSQVLGRKYHSISMHCWLWMWYTVTNLYKMAVHSSHMALSGVLRRKNIQATDSWIFWNFRRNYSGFLFPAPNFFGKWIQIDLYHKITLTCIRQLSSTSLFRVWIKQSIQRIWFKMFEASCRFRDQNQEINSLFNLCWSRPKIHMTSVNR